VGALLLSVAGVISIAEVGAVPSGVPPLRLDLPGRPASAAAPAVIARVGFAEAATGAVPHHGHRQAMLARKHALAHPAWSCLRLGDVRPGERRLFIAEGKGGHQRIVPISDRFFVSLAAYLSAQRPEPAADDHVFWS